MRKQHEIKRAFIPVLGNVVLVFLGLTVALGLAEVFMRVFPNWLPAQVRVNPPARRVNALIDETYDLRQSDGDLFHYMRGNIAPLSVDQVIAQVHMVTDANGFRNSPPEKAAYGIVALGDSFTRASGVSSSWPQKLAEYSGNDVLNLADVGFGPQDELKVLQQYGLKKHPQWVIMAYFEGNDLYDVASYEQANPFILFRFGRFILDQAVDAWHERSSGEASAEIISNYHYPITIMVNGKELEMVFFSSYVSWLSVSRDVIDESQNYRLVRETIMEIKELSEAAGANFLLVYIPSKSHIYLPYMKDPETIASVFTNIPAIALDNKGFLQFTNKTVTPELVHKHMDDQVILLAEFAEEQSIDFLDLTDTFQSEAGNGVELYYLYDSHWNQFGHDLAAKAIDEYIGQALPYTTNRSTGK